ncbi:hypothetical protein [Paraburkholderia domus]|uniref:hypothetical protein n=1 Tax=Paraburkholderia domus TaxID=2793075 RepID=UPI001AFEDEB1|nr:hypothetical protein [Paraburkholderia domus]CAE6907626.1 hypothetical protein R69749_08485 [Paraburkholderia domus]
MAKLLPPRAQSSDNFPSFYATVIDVYPGDGDWTRLFSDIVGPEGLVYSFVPAEVAHFKNDPVGLMRTLAKEPGRENVEVVSADLVAMPQATCDRRSESAIRRRRVRAMLNETYLPFAQELLVEA